ncbi:ABC transporter permease subunit [Bacillus marinisedimentorum]|uniref:ABC transporter permease subunit n=1 Tax=Bacillus marinisedimentorum TaxID=1821260 RepID=UPI001FE17C62|nr:ABC transporter permease subunit [Bacillus marinisedimentorum]
MSMYIWKEWKEQTRSKGLWLAAGMVFLINAILMLEARSLPVEQGFTALLLSLHEMNVYLIPILGLFISSFAVIQEKELKTYMMLTTKRESKRSFLLKKSLAVHAVTLSVFIAGTLIMALPMKLFFLFDMKHFLAFLITIAAFLIIFNQIGIFLGSICTTRMQLVGANIFTWFFFLFLTDIGFMYALPAVSYDNIQIFSVFYFIDPLHALSFYLDTALGVLSIDHLSRLMDKMVFVHPAVFLAVNAVIWSALSFELAVRLNKGGERA